LELDTGYLKERGSWHSFVVTWFGRVVYADLIFKDHVLYVSEVTTILETKMVCKTQSYVEAGFVPN